MISNDYVNIKRVFADKLDTDKSAYRSSVKFNEKYNWRIIYKYSDMFIGCDKDISFRLEKLVREVYDVLESFIRKDKSFRTSLSPVKIREESPLLIKKMCQKATIFNVGPMASVAGAVCDYIAAGVDKYCHRLIIENGGDVFIKSNKDIDIGVFLKNENFKNKIYLKIKAKQTPCGICSSSGSFGHSLSMGKSDLVVVLSKSTISADAAATAIANKIIKPSDIEGTIEYYKKIKDVKGLLIVKDEKLGIWGDIELMYI
jgi:ApbE superfamily uncharacterized protein (UPF0280 family)